MHIQKDARAVYLCALSSVVLNRVVTEVSDCGGHDTEKPGRRSFHSPLYLPADTQLFDYK